LLCLACVCTVQVAHSFAVISLPDGARGGGEGDTARPPRYREPDPTAPQPHCTWVLVGGNISVYVYDHIAQVVITITHSRYTSGSYKAHLVCNPGFNIYSMWALN
jgi:hypothetical protein